MPRNLTGTPGNPAWDINRIYAELMDGIQRIPQLGLARVLGIIDDYTGQGISLKNAHFWKEKFTQAYETGNWGGIRNNPIGALQKVVTDFILGADDMSAGGSRRGGPRLEAVQVHDAADAHIQTVANLMNEDTEGYRIDLDADLMGTIKLLNHYGFAVAINEEGGFDAFTEPDTGLDTPPIDAGMADEEMPDVGYEDEVEAGIDEACPLADIVDWARQNGCPEDLCAAAEMALSSENENAEDGDYEEVDGVAVSNEPPGPPIGVGPPVRRRAAPNPSVGAMESKKPSAGLTKKQKSTVAKKAAAGKDIGKKGKGFKKVEAAAKKSGAKDPKAVAAAAMWKNIPRNK